MSSQFSEVGSMKFMGLQFRVFMYEHRAWIPLMDLANGLGYAKPDKLWDLVNGNPKLFAEQGWILDGRDAKVGGEILPHQGSFSAPGKFRPGRIFTTYQGVMMCLMLNRSAKADDFKIWAANRLVPSMVRRMVRENPMDDMTPKERLLFLKDAQRIKQSEQDRKKVTSPMYFLRELLKGTHKFAQDYHSIPHFTDAERAEIDMIKEQLLSMCESIDVAIKGKKLF